LNAGFTNAGFTTDDPFRNGRAEDKAAESHAGNLSRTWGGDTVSSGTPLFHSYGLDWMGYSLWNGRGPCHPTENSKNSRSVSGRRVLLLRPIQHTGLNCYKGIWDHNPTDDVAIRYCFFCWYLIWQWEQIDFPGEDISFEAKITVDNRMGISKAELEHTLSSIACGYSNNFQIEYKCILVHLKRLIPYAFSFSSKSTETLLSELQKAAKGNAVAQAILRYQQDNSFKCKSDSDQISIQKFFPTCGLMDEYFRWLLL
jgi:hypothetical protein